MGMQNRAAEAQKLANGINITAAILGQPLDHRQNILAFMYKILECLVIDEADCILDARFRDICTDTTQRESMIYLERTGLFNMTLQMALRNTHCVSRTVRGLNGSGQGLIILCRGELGFLPYLKLSKVPLNQFDFLWSEISDIQSYIEKLR
ncbi:hypothetical protein A6R68_24097, partial [Neotoma lepida]